LQFLKVCSTEVIKTGTLAFSSFSQFSKEDIPKEERLLGKVISVKFEQSIKQESLIVNNEFGRFIKDNEEQPEKASTPKSVTPVSSSIVLKAVQFLNAPSSIVFNSFALNTTTTEDPKNA
jgi:hypothetical protein